MSVLTDSGVENVNDTVDEFLSGGILEAGSTSETASREPGRHVRDVHGDVGANDGPRERSLIEEGNPKTVEESTVTKYREGMSRMS